jgi:hypothetical protein
LDTLTGAHDFANRSTLTIQRRDNTDDSTVATTASRAPLEIHLDTATGTYTLVSNGQTVSFTDADFVGNNGSGDRNYFKEQGGKFQYLTMINPGRLGAGTKYVSGGLWQRLVTSGTRDDFEFDVFVYGFPTAARAVPVNGTASFDVDLFGVASPLGIFPRSVIGNGTVSVDFGQGLFSMSGEAGEYNNDAEYSTCCSDWRGSGYLGSSGLLSGFFSYDGRDRHDYQAMIEGGLYGPAGQEIGGTLLGGTSGGGTFTGVFAGTRLGSTISDPLSALSQGARSYPSFRGTFFGSQRSGNSFSNADTYYIPGDFGLAKFGADGSFTLPMGINDPRFADVTFTSADIVAAESGNSFTVYQLNNANGAYRLSLSKPGPANPSIQLTYSSFGSWQETRAIGDLARQTMSTWFYYGVPTASKSLPLSGSAHYDAKILGSGERYTDTERLTLSGDAKIDIDFAAMSLAGVFNAQAKTTTNQLVALPVVTFGGDLNDVYAFQSYLIDPTSRIDGSITGRLYGPSGEEIGGTFEFFTRLTPGGTVDAGYAGVIYGKRD